MRSFRNNQKRMRTRSSIDRTFKRSNEINRLNSDFGNRENGFRRKNNRNNGNVEKLITKYNELARRHFQMAIKYFLKTTTNMQITF